VVANEEDEEREDTTKKRTTKAGNQPDMREIVKAKESTLIYLLPHSEFVLGNQSC